MARRTRALRDNAERKKFDSAATKAGGQRTRDYGPITEHEIEDIEERSSPRTPVIYEIVRRLGEEEMARPVTSLWWSGLAAGLSISFSLLAQAILRTHLPDESWRPLVSSFGYSVGFIIVVLARQQLFTETTITVVLPVMAEFTARNLALMGRMWVIVLCANFAGTLFAALFCSLTPVLTPELKAAMLDISRGILNHGGLEMFVKAISAGFLMAAMVWLIPSADTAQVHVVTLMTYLIAAGGFMHIVAGSMEAFMLVVSGDQSWMAMIAHFVLPVLAGNIVGGTALFALLSYAQVMKEI
jgi:formate-nitrite transporter family protein